MSDDKHEIVPRKAEIVEAREAVNPWNVTVPREDRDELWTTIPIGTDEGRFIFQEALEGEVAGFDGHINKIFDCVHLLVHPVDVTDKETGEVQTLPRMVLIGPKGEMVACVSRGATQSIRRVAINFGRPPWNPPLPLDIGQRDVGENRRMYFLRVNRDEFLKRKYPKKQAKE